MFPAERLQSELAERNKQGATATSALACKVSKAQQPMAPAVAPCYAL